MMYPTNSPATPTIKTTMKYVLNLTIWKRCKPNSAAKTMEKMTAAGMLALYA